MLYTETQSRIHIDQRSHSGDKTYEHDECETCYKRVTDSSNLEIPDHIYYGD